MASFTLNYDMVVSGSVNIEAENLDDALVQMKQISRAELVKGLDNSTADPVTDGFQMHDEHGEQVY